MLNAHFVYLSNSGWFRLMSCMSEAAPMEMVLFWIKWKRAYFQVMKRALPGVISKIIKYCLSCHCERLHLGHKISSVCVFFLNFLKYTKPPSSAPEGTLLCFGVYSCHVLGVSKGEQWEWGGGNVGWSKSVLFLQYERKSLRAWKCLRKGTGGKKRRHFSRIHALSKV